MSKLTKSEMKEVDKANSKIMRTMGEMLVKNEGSMMTIWSKIAPSKDAEHGKMGQALIGDRNDLINMIVNAMKQSEDFTDVIMSAAKCYIMHDDDNSEAMDKIKGLLKNLLTELKKQ
jgi:hypothetical protein